VCVSAGVGPRQARTENEVKFDHTDPDMVPRLSLTGDSTQRVDTRVLQVITASTRARYRSMLASRWTSSLRRPQLGRRRRSATSLRTMPRRSARQYRWPHTPAEETLDASGALKMLVGDRTKYAGLLFGITFTSFPGRVRCVVFLRLHHTRICSDRREPIGGRLGHAPGG